MKDREAPPQARVALGEELAAYRRAAGCTQARLTQLTKYSRSTIANVETGRQHVPRSFWERADAALRTGGTLATGYDELEAATRRDLRAAAQHVSTARQAQRWQHDLDLSTTGPTRRHADDRGAGARSAETSWWPAEQERAVSADGVRARR